MPRVGDTIFAFDINRRVYPTGPAGEQVTGGPVYAEHFVPAQIVGETTTSWIADNGTRKPHKINKRTMKEAGARYLPIRWFTADGMADDIWLKENRHVIASRVSGESDVGRLKRVLAILEEER